MKKIIVAFVLASLASGAVIVPRVAATGTEAVDTVVTGSLGKAEISPVADSKGSAAFQAALALLTQGEAAAAYAAAAKLSDEVERRTAQWAAIYYGRGKIDAASVDSFAQDAPQFAPPSLYQTRLEQALQTDDKSDVLTLLEGREPATVAGQIRYAEALLGDGRRDEAGALARQIWTGNYLDPEQEVRVRDRFGSMLDRDAHWKRATMLMMHDRAKGSERLLPFLSDAQKGLVEARAAVSRDDADAKNKLDAVAESLQGDPVYIFSRAQRARQFELWQSAVDWLNKAEGEVPEPGEWWKERQSLIARLMAEGEPKLAFEAAAGFTHGSSGPLVQARFMAGWIALTFLDDAAAARTQFTEMAEHATLPDSITQANYWLGRAELAKGDVDAARAAFTKAAEIGTVYYGQLARAELGSPQIVLRPMPEWQESQTLFNGHQVVRAIRLLSANGEKAWASTLLRHFGSTLASGGELLLAARLAQDIGANNLAISIAVQAEQKGFPLDQFSFPKDGVPANAKLQAERAAVFAVVRQESMFQLDAVSHAGARGLMQLMPGTAKEVARGVGVGYSPSRLVSDAAYNMLLGSTYLGAQLERYGGSLLLAAAAYNAGPGNANKWIRAYGDPRNPAVDPVVWVELIPFAETRTYVKRVLGNYLVYRQRLGEEPLSLKQALRTIR